MAARGGLHFLRLSDIQIMKHFQHERLDVLLKRVLALFFPGSRAR